METAENNQIPNSVRKYTAKPKMRGKNKKKNIDDYVLPSTGKTIHASDRVDEILYDK